MKKLVNAATRVVRSPGLFAGIVVLHLALGSFVGGSARAFIGAAMGQFSVLADGHLFYHLIYLFFDNRSALPALMRVLAGSAVIGVIFWTILSAGIIRRLQGKITWAKTLATGVQFLPSMLAITVWHAIPKMILLGICGAATGKLMGEGNWGLVGIGATLLVLSATTCALDLARCSVVLHGARRYSLRTALRGYRQAFRRRGVLLASVAASVGQWFCVIGMLWIGLNHPQSESLIWVVRGLSVVGVFCVLCRIAVAVQAGPYLSEPSRS